MKQSMLVHTGKHGQSYFLIDSENPQAAWLKVFNRVYLEQFNFTPTESREMYLEEFAHRDRIIFEQALDGNPGAARTILDIRSDYEYENVIKEELE